MEVKTLRKNWDGIIANAMKSAVELPNGEWTREAAANLNEIKSAVVRHELRCYYGGKTPMKI